MKLLKINPSHPEKKKLKIAAEVIRAGGIVAFPTETVYGLGTDALNPIAVASVFQKKNRPLDQPLIIAIASPSEITRLVKTIPKKAKQLIDKFFPGPLTLVLLKSEIVPDIVTGGTEKVAFRIPNHPVALELLKETKRPITATSANRTGHPSPTDAKQVLNDFGNSLDLILDAGPTKLGIESTILDLTGKPTILRLGAVSKEAIETIIGNVRVEKL